MPSAVASLPVDPELGARDALAAGDVRSALTSLMRLYGEEIYRYCRLQLGDASLAEDVHQTVFVEAFRDLASFEGRSSLRTWLYRIAHHRCLDAAKRRRRWWRRFSLSDELPERADSRPLPDAGLERAAMSAALEAALGALPAKTRSAVLLRLREGLSFPEIAAIVGDKPATLQARVSRALPALRRALAKEAP